jgi:DNA-binding NtrC family response regulator
MDQHAGEPAPQGGDSRSASTPIVSLDFSVSYSTAKREALQRWERAYLGELLRRAGPNLSRAARIAGTDRNYLRDRLKRHAMWPMRGAVEL